MSGKGKNNFQSRLDNQKEQLERNGYSAEVVVRTTPEATDMINFARLWEHLLVNADRRTRGYMSKAPREDYEKTRQAFIDSMEFMMERMREEVARHDLDLAGNNFVARIAQRYKLSERKKGADKPEKPKAKEAKEAKPAEKPAEKPKAEAAAEPKKPAAEAPKPAAKPAEVESL